MKLTFSEALEKAEDGRLQKQQHRQAAQEGILDSVFNRSVKTYYLTTYPTAPGDKATSSVPDLEDFQDGRSNTVPFCYLTEDEALLHGIVLVNDKVDAATKTIYTTAKRLKRIGYERITIYSIQASGFKQCRGDSFYSGSPKSVQSVTTISTMTVVDAAKRLGYRFDAKKDESFERHTAFVCAVTLLKKEMKQLGIRTRIDVPKVDVQDWVDQEEDEIWLAEATFRPIGGDEETAIANINRFMGVVGSVNEKFQAQYGRKYRIVGDGDKWDVCAVLEAR